MMNSDFKNLMDRQLSTLEWTQAGSNAVLRKLRGETKVRKKLSLGLILAIVIVMASVAALAAYALTRSPQADATTRARQALMQQYGLTPETLGLFDAHAEQDGDTWTVTFCAASIHESLIGSYTVVLTDEYTAANWTFDDVDPAEWQNGDLNAPVWGQPQMEAALHDHEAAYAISVERYQQSLQEGGAESSVQPEPTPDIDPSTLAEGDSWWQGQILHAGTPGEGDLTKEAALEIAYQALMEEFGLTREQLEASTTVWADFHTRDEGNPLWGFSIFVDHNGVMMDCGIMMDARTGEILLTNVITGANG